MDRAQIKFCLFAGERDRPGRSPRRLAESIVKNANRLENFFKDQKFQILNLLCFRTSQLCYDHYVFSETLNTAGGNPEQHKNCPLCGLPALPKTLNFKLGTLN